MIYTIFLTLHIVVSLLLVVVILLQSSKGGGLAGSAFGGGAGGSSFLGARGTATFMSRATTILAIIFMLNSLSLSFIVSGSSSPVSVTQQAIQSEAQNLPRVAGDADLGMGEVPAQELPVAGESAGGDQSAGEGQEE
ncbi:preprotein translocase subunit SecG [candidate division LCP-89 bacterium B3_LCP]|uniref:Protein-export membrane protein SecG n=1 Tax=candidate division LCP-89 bacterium B3_LCP TaxID=2012998 RepID=A0A532V3Z5_UNCL8|nr:MAG: preprotein translocase subunit SecG [candidate division LCP-89 bacterium B3_LCP]